MQDSRYLEKFLGYFWSKLVFFTGEIYLYLLGQVDYISNFVYRQKYVQKSIFTKVHSCFHASIRNIKTVMENINN